MKTVRSFLLIAVFGLLTFSTTDLMAQRGFYFGGSLGPSFTNMVIYDLTWDDVKIDGNEFAYKVYAGVKLPAFFALEGGYRNLGRISDDIAAYNSSGWDLNAKANLELGPFQIFGKAGAFFNDVDVTFNNPLQPDINNQNTKFMVGFGAGLNIDKFGIRAEWESLDITKDNKVSMLTAGITYRLF